MRRTLGQIRAYVAAAISPDGDGESPSAHLPLTRRVRAGIYLGRLWVRILKQWARDRCPQTAAALGYQTALSLVPLLAIAFALLGSIGEEAKRSFLDFLSTQVFPEMPDVAGYLEKFLQNIRIGAAGGGGLLVFLLTNFSLYLSVEKSFNDIWRVNAKRSLVGKFLTFYALVTLLPVLAVASLFVSARLVGTDSAGKYVGPWLIQFAALALTNKLLPNTYVKWRSAVAAALVTGFILEALKLAVFDFAKQMLLTSYQGVYGGFGLVPMVLVWMYVSWLLVLLGAEIAHATQNLGLLEAEDRRRFGHEPVNGVVASQLLAFVAADHERGGTGVSREQIARAFALTTDVVDRVIARLKEQALIAEVHGDKEGLIPGRASTSIKVGEVLTAFRATDLEMARGTTSPALTALVRDFEETRRTRIAGMTLADLLPDPGPMSPSAPHPDDDDPSV